MDARSAAVPLKVHLDLQVTLMADTLYRILARRLGNGMENAHARTLFRKVVNSSATIDTRPEQVVVSLGRRVNNPLLIAAGFAERSPAHNMARRPATADPLLLKTDPSHHLGRAESGAGAPALGSGGLSVAFAPGLSPAPLTAFPVPAPRTRRADFRHRALQRDRAPRTRNPGTARMEGAGRPAIRNRCTAAILSPAASSVRRRAWSRLDDIEPFRSDPFASARDAIRCLRPPGGVIGSATPAAFVLPASLHT